MSTFDPVCPIPGRAASRAAPMEIGEFVRTRLGFEPDEKQMEVLQSGARRRVLNCSRQRGKFPDSVVLVASPSMGQSAEFLLKVQEMAGRLGIPAVSLLLIDEAALVGEEMPRVRRPTPGTVDGDLWLISTPCGRRGLFYQAWAHGGAGVFDPDLVEAAVDAEIPALPIRPFRLDDFRRGPG